MQVTDIDAKIDEAIFYLEKTVDEIEKDEDSYEIFPCEVTLSSEVKNHGKTIFEINEMIQGLRNLKNIHRIFKINDAMKVSMFSSLLNNDDPQPIIISEPYTVTEQDTLQSIGSRYNVDWKKIAEFNDLDSMDLTAGQEINIPREFDPKLILDFSKSKNPVFDLPDGENVLGHDLPNALEANDDGDLKVLGNRATFVQGMENIINTDEGAMPFYPNYGLDTWIGDDIPREVTDDWRKQKIINSFLKDARVFEVPYDELEITNSAESCSIKVNIYPVQGLSFSTLIAETYFK